MTEGAGQFHEADLGARRIERVNHRPAFAGWIEPVGIKADQAKAGF